MTTQQLYTSIDATVQPNILYRGTAETEIGTLVERTRHTTHCTHLVIGQRWFAYRQAMVELQYRLWEQAQLAMIDKQ